MSYRNDCLGWAVTLDQALRAAYGDDRVFRAGRSVRPGARYEDVILSAAAGCRLLLCVIGPTWLEPGPDGDRLVDRPEDFVRRELGAAFGAGADVLPVLVAGAGRLTGARLPAEIASLVELQSEHLRGQSIDDDLGRIMAHLAKIVQPQAEPARPGPPPEGPGVEIVAERPDETVASPDPFPSPLREGQFDMALVVQALIAIPGFTDSGLRNRLVSLLRAEIGGILSRYPEARPEAVSMVFTCARFPGGMHELFQAVHLCVGDVPELRPLYSAITTPM